MDYRLLQNVLLPSKKIDNLRQIICHFLKNWRRMLLIYFYFVLFPFDFISHLFFIFLYFTVIEKGQGFWARLDSFRGPFLCGLLQMVLIQITCYRFFYCILLFYRVYCRLRSPVQLTEVYFLLFNCLQPTFYRLTVYSQRSIV